MPSSLTTDVGITSPLILQLPGREIAIPNVVPRLTDTPGRVKWLGPPAESHNDDVYRGMLGLSPAEIETLRAGGVI